MFFLDGTGFFALVGLLTQCGMASILVGLLAVLLRHSHDAARFRLWHWAILCLAIALWAIGVRYLLAYQHVGFVDRVHEDAPLTRALYVVYQTGKVMFAWLILCGTARLVGRPPTAWHTKLGAVLVAYAVTSALLADNIHVLLLVQAPVIVSCSAIAWHWLGLFQRQRGDAGSRIVRAALCATAVLWAFHGVAVTRIGFGVNPTPEGWNTAWAVMLRLNTYVDLFVQVVLGAGMIALILQDAQHEMLQAQNQRDHLRDELARDEKLRAIGTLVSGVAHELNNPLTAILGFADLLETDKCPPGLDAAKVIHEQAERCRDIVQSLSILAGQCAHPRESVAIRATLQRVVRGFAPQAAAAGIEVAVVCDADDLVVLGNRTGIEQVLTNLIANALHATPPGGKVTLTASRADDQVEISVQDTGVGVSPELRSRLFEPFFTSKKSGMGLGLAMSRAFVQANHGSLRLVDRPMGTGAEFVIRLPAAPSQPALPADAQEKHQPITGMHLLLVDDEPLVREVLALRAQALGWQVSHAASGAAALTLLHANADTYDAVICDLRMPDQGGVEVYDHLQRMAPRVLQRFVFITGDLASPEAADFAARCSRPLLQKPFDLDRLFREVAAVARSA